VNLTKSGECVLAVLKETRGCLSYGRSSKVVDGLTNVVLHVSWDDSRGRMQ